MTYDPYNQQPPGSGPYGQQPGQPYGMPGQPQYGYGGYPPPPQSQQTAIIALVLACAGIVCCLTWLVAPVFGHIALGKIKRGEEGGKGLAIAALCISYGFIALNIILFATGVTAALLQENFN